ncbi:MULTISPECIES: hypothetical protein [Ruminococcus]|uniref:Uncharacterized protein n=1 Tax=Ruminococcus flavefaciens TaxID=1265 RepID=A0A1M7M965_RUMFL|nr:MULTISPECIES: hypothetical protein [Ruminococcus]MCR4794145.1 hypothetical protein [Ruminococcus sp.]SHM87245.1 hypothetical protein SAMN04487860_1204 [Ruminococcus flavefaciens]
MCIEMFGNLHYPYDQKTPEIVDWGIDEKSARGMQNSAAPGNKEPKKLIREDEKQLLAECLVTLKRVERIIHELY